MAVDRGIQNQLKFSRFKEGTLIRRAQTKRSAAMRHPDGISMTYSAALVALVRQWRDLYLKIVDPQLDNIVAEAYLQRPGNAVNIRTDAWTENLALLIGELELGVTATLTGVEALALDIGQKVSDWNDNQWRKSMRSVLGIELFSSEPWLRDQIQSFADQGDYLAKKLAADIVADINQITTNGIQQGRRAEAISKDILSTTKLDPGNFRKKETRARLIARDQTAKMNGQLTQLRQNEVGIDKYVWRTSLDERVRSSHRIMDGLLCRWDDVGVYSNNDGRTWLKRSSIGGVEQHPGQDFQCRCTAEAFFGDLFPGGGFNE